MSFDGFLLVDKPEGPSSFDVVRRARKEFNTKKAGHCGTLDPLASGLLIVAIGKATRLIPYLPIEPKVYEFGIQFGKKTNTLDREGEIVKDGEPLPTEEQISNVLKDFIGEIEQTPPKFSAIKINGVPAYKLARKEKEFEIKSRNINIYELALLDYNSDIGVADMRVKCSGGTYVRVLSEQIAEKCNTIGYASYIRRTDIGAYSVTDAVSMEEDDNNWKENISSVWDIFKAMPCSEVSEEQESELTFGREVTVDGRFEERLFLFQKNRDLAAIVEKKENGNYGPKKVFLKVSQ